MAIQEDALVLASSDPRRRYRRRSKQRLVQRHSVTHEYSPATRRPEIVLESSSLYFSSFYPLSSHSAQPDTLLIPECHRSVPEAVESQLERHLVCRRDLA